VDGGFGAISKTEVPRTDFVCQSKVLKTNWFEFTTINT
jgi:hypothetical protein